ncbi:hypothetical protein STEG23_005722 [Scotinomys teguina]
MEMLPGQGGPKMEFLSQKTEVTEPACDACGRECHAVEQIKQIKNREHQAFRKSKHTVKWPDISAAYLPPLSLGSQRNLGPSKYLRKELRDNRSSIITCMLTKASNSSAI